MAFIEQKVGGRANSLPLPELGHPCSPILGHQELLVLRSLDLHWDLHHWHPGSLAFRLRLNHITNVPRCLACRRQIMGFLRFQKHMNKFLSSLNIYLYIYVCLSIIYLSIYLPTYLSIYLPTYLPTYLCIIYLINYVSLGTPDRYNGDVTHRHLG